MVFTLSWFGQVSHPPCLMSGTGFVCCGFPREASTQRVPMVVIDGGHFIFAALSSQEGGLVGRRVWLLFNLVWCPLTTVSWGLVGPLALETPPSFTLIHPQLDACTARLPPPLHRRRSATGDEEAASTGREPSWDLRGKVPVAAPSCSAFSRRVPLARAMPDNESSRCFVRSSSLFYLRGRAPPGAVATRLRRCLGFAWLIMNLSSSFSLKPSGAVTPSWIVYCVARY
ncbi:hypothetical protein PAPYR_11971 [Paratrimastix pyriformis]|uniref:Uncharacterized protein n=1 Tax=Paratrimastix pyriformis TaxID=342808 RepID=A0ABQ8U2R1_9EUKA|nr:hypothetical protein PAPYR_11971 [Paratrimastix pyriformis]